MISARHPLPPLPQTAKLYFLMTKHLYYISQPAEQRHGEDALNLLSASLKNKQDNTRRPL